LCDLTEVCIPGFSCFDPDGNLVSCSTSLGTLSGDTVCFTPTGEGTYEIILTATDAFGETAVCTTQVAVTLNDPPVATCPGDTSLFVCDLSPICIPGFSCSDVDGNLVSCVPSLGTLSGDTVCFTPTGSGVYDIVLTATDACNATGVCTTKVTVTLNSPPTADAGPDDSVFQCTPAQICRAAGCSDPDNNLDSCYLVGGPGTFDGSQICFTPDTSGTYRFTLRAVDACGEADEDIVQIQVQINSPPVADAGPDDSVFQCFPAQICWPAGCSDPDNNLDSCYLVSGPGTFDGSQICFTPDTAGSYTFVLRAVDSCGESDLDTAKIIVTLNSTPVADDPATPVDTFMCDPGQVCYQFTADDVDGGTLVWTKLSGDGGVTPGGLWCFDVTADGAYSVVVAVADSCGAADTTTLTYNVTLNSPPLADAGPDDSVFQCFPAQICWPAGCGDSEGNLDSCYLVSGPGSFDGSQICFTPTGSGSYDFVLKAVDACGEVDYDTAKIDVTFGDTVTIDCPSAAIDTFLCTSDSIIYPLPITPDTAAVTVSYGVYADGAIRFFADTAGNYVIRVIAAVTCDADTCILTFNVGINSPPTADAGPDDSVFQCTPAQICWPAGCSDPDGNLDSCYLVSGPGTLDGSQICFTPDTAGSYTFVLKAVDDCGAEDYDTATITVTINSPPVCTSPNDTTVKICDVLPDSICVPPFTVNDSDGNLSSCTVNGDPYTPGTPYCFTPVLGSNTLVLTCSDACGAQTQCSVFVGVIDTCLPECPTVVVEKTHLSIQGQHEYVDVIVEDGVFDMGGFDFLIVYDRSAVNFQSVAAGDLYDLCDWEYFTYRTWFWPSYEPHFFWGGVVRVVGLADMNDGANHPSCNWLPTPFVLFTLDLLVTDNRLFECQFAPISFFWTDCGDNTMSDVTGDSLYVSRSVFGFDQVGEITDLNSGFPTYTGVQAECLVGGGPDKPAPKQCIDFYSGGVDIACAEDLDERGDINLNGVAYEIADAVVFANYFIYGLSAFSINVNGQIAATDVNADGLTLTVGDLVYLVRVIVGDALPYPKLAPVEATYTINDGVISVDADMGAAFVIIEGNVQPTLLAADMEMKLAYDADQNVTRVLVYSFEGNGFSGEFLNAAGEVVSLEFGSYEGALVKAVEVPLDFSLRQNYPNPFNPVTTISFTLPSRSEYMLTIYNVTGQVVREFAGQAEAGLASVEFDAADLASGVYFYRLRAGDHTATRKMLLIK
ncbi:MAG: T9SS type A sorting domain-containing protein, partial [Candidatus Zixiibacteriota bacterium]